MLYMVKLCLIIFGIIVVIYVINAIYEKFLDKKRNLSTLSNKNLINISFNNMMPKKVELLESECGMPNKPLREDNTSYNDNIKKYKEIDVEGICPEKTIIKVCK